MTSKALIICLFRWFCPGEGVFYCIKISRNIDPNKCIGCGICTTKCKFDAIRLEKVNDTHGREYFRTLLTVAGNTPAAIGRLVRKTRGR